VNPQDVYRERLAAHEAARLRFDRLDGRIANARLALFGVFLLLLWLALGPGVVPWWTCLGPVLVYLVVAVIHENSLRDRRRAQRAADFYQKGLARLEHRWQEAGATGDRFQDASHPYSGDLDLFGHGSLFQLLSRARTRSGEETLANWLKEPAPPEELRRRQEAVRELRDKLQLRENLAVLGEEWQLGGHPQALRSWAQMPGALPAPAWRAGAVVLTIAGVGALVAWAAGATGAAPVALIVIAQILFRRPLRTVAKRAGDKGDEARADLDLLGLVLARWEEEEVQAPLLRSVHESIVQPRRASTAIRTLNRLADYHEARRNQMLAPLAYFLLWDVHFALAIEAWRVRHGARVTRWLEAIGQLEALSSLASHAFEHPDDPFPEIDDAGPPRLEAVGLGHPLLPEATCVRNDVRLAGGPVLPSDRPAPGTSLAPSDDVPESTGTPALPPIALLVVSGSNMSGKSTFLRSVGVAAVLAQAGAPVRARRLRLTPLAVAASIRVIDSLQSNVSHFYAEIQRLRLIADRTHLGTPVLFLVDEMLHGTNSHDRRIGTEAVLRGFVERGAVGIITTHDLALTELTGGLAGRGANAHFADELVDGRMMFDYRLRPGVVRRSNALELMRAVGLSV